MSDEKLQQPPLSRAQVELLKDIQSSKPTPYRLRTAAGVVVHVFCAHDALLYTLLTQQQVMLEAQPPTGDPFTLMLTLNGPEHFDLWQSLVSDVAALPESSGVPSKRCPYQHLFSRLNDAERWRADLPPSLAPVVQLLPLHEGWQRAQERIRALAGGPSESTPTCCT